jgi:hypothetical protein
MLLLRGNWCSQSQWHFSNILLIIGEVPEWPKGADCKSAGDAFEGSNPSLSTIFAGIAQLVEREPSKLGVAGSSPVSRSSSYMAGCQNSRWCNYLDQAIGDE